MTRLSSSSSASWASSWWKTPPRAPTTGARNGGSWSGRQAPKTGLLLARADGTEQAAAVGQQVAGRVGFFLQVADFGDAYGRMSAAGVRFVTSPRLEPYGRVAVFLDVAGNKWDLIGPAG